MPNCHRLLVKNTRLPGLKNRVLGRSKISFYLDGKLMLETEVRKEEWESELEIHNHQDVAVDFLGELDKFLKADPFIEKMLNEAAGNLFTAKPPLFRPEMVERPKAEVPIPVKEVPKAEEPKKPEMIVVRVGDCIRCGSKKKDLKEMPCIVFNRMFRSHLPKK